MVWTVLVVFFAGFAVGKFFNTSWIGRYKIVLALTFFLLLSLGLRIGSNDELFRKIDQIALYGLLIALFASAGSFVFGILLERFLGRSRGAERRPRS